MDQNTENMYLSFCLMDLFPSLMYDSPRQPNKEQNTENIKVAWRIWICFYYNVTTLRCMICKACDACLRCRQCKMWLYRAEEKTKCQKKMLIFYISVNHRYVQSVIYHLNIPTKHIMSRSQYMCMSWSQWEAVSDGLSTFRSSSFYNNL